MSGEYTSVYIADASERVDSFLSRISAEEDEPLSRSAAAKLCEDGKVTVEAGKETITFEKSEVALVRLRVEF